MTQPTQNLSTTLGRQRRRWKMLASSVLLLAVAVVARYYWGLSGVAAQAPQAARPAAPPAAPAVAKAATSPAKAAAPATPDPSTLKVMAIVNSEQVSREDLARDCLRHYGKEVLERLVNKHLILQECKRRNVSVTATEVNQEIERLAGRFGMPTDQWLELLRKERGVTPSQYGADIIWPTLALRKLAGEQLQVSPEEIDREYEAMYGPSVKARLIVCDTRNKAEAVRAQAVANPDAFGNLAKEHSVDPSASLKGLVQPIRKCSGDSPLEAKIEQVAFTLKDGEISPVISLGNDHMILKREEEIAGRNLPKTEQLRSRLEEIVRDRKLKGVAHDVFGRLQKDAHVENVFNDPAKSQQTPGVAAVINGQQLTLRELSEVCIDRHGSTVLEGAINHRLVEQACKKANITISEADLDEEITRTAALSLPANPDGSPDVKGWQKMVTDQGISLEIYRRDEIWPRVALKKLVGNTVAVTEEDIQKGFDANYGPRVRCRAIVLDSLRQAQVVWDKARKVIAEKPRDKAEAFFGELAEQYSMESSSKALKGEIPPIQRHGGIPLLEKEAFDLKAGELSSVIQVDAQHYVILYCLGQTTPVGGIDLATVRQEIYRDIHEKKLNMAMADRLDQIKEDATIDNFLTGSSHSPKKKTAQTPAPAQPVRR